MGWIKELFTVYSTTRVVQIRSKFLAITYVTLVALVWSAVLRSYQLDLRKIYQKRCPVRGTFTTKVKGILSTENYSEEELNITSPQSYRRLWDTQDLVINGESGFTVMTNIVITSNQGRRTCASSSMICENDEDCLMGSSDSRFDGILTGYCFAEGKCEISAWCPAEENELPLNGVRPLFHDTENFTVLVKVSVEFPDCEPELQIGDGPRDIIYKRRNILENFTSEYLKTCRYDPVNHPYCPIFILGDIIKWSGQNYDKVGITGGVIGIIIYWDCDFDWGLTIRDCLPSYHFVRHDVLESQGIAPGFNWRSAVYFGDNRRTLTKYYGLKFSVKIAGEGRQFDFLLLILTIGATIGLFSFAPLFCDFLFDLFCYLKSFSICNYCFSDSFDKEIRVQSVLPQTRPPTPSPRLTQNRRAPSSLFEQTEYNSSVSYDTRL